MIKLSILVSALFFLNTYPGAGPSRYEHTPDGPAINWSPDVLLEWSDFKAKKKSGGGFAVASSTCGFGFDGIKMDDEISVNVYVRFYCTESWHHKDYNLAEVLKHEQLHFDICELYGRIFYKNVLFLRRSGSLNERTIKKVLSELMEEYDQTQKRYDDETNHSTNELKQTEWKEKITHALNDFAQYADYKEF